MRPDSVLDVESRYFLEKLYTDSVDRGMNPFESPVRNRLKAIGERLRQFTDEFDENLPRPANPFLWMTPQELEGVPDTALYEETWETQNSNGSDSRASPTSLSSQLLAPEAQSMEHRIISDRYCCSCSILKFTNLKAIKRSWP